MGIVACPAGGFDGRMRETVLDETVLDGALDLLLGGACVGCARPGRLLCPDCKGGLPDHAAPAWPTPTPPGLVEPWAAAAYEGTVRAMVLGLKERRLLGLAVPLARLLAAAVSCELPQETPVVLVPVPSRARTVRMRGHDPTRTITVRAARQLRSRGFDVEVASAAPPAARSGRPGRSRRGRASGEPGWLDGGADGRRAQVRAPAPRRPVGGLRRRADQRLDSP